MLVLCLMLWLLKQTPFPLASAGRLDWCPIHKAGAVQVANAIRISRG